MAWLLVQLLPTKKWEKPLRTLVAGVPIPDKPTDHHHTHRDALGEACPTTKDPPKIHKEGGGRWSCLR